MLGFLLETHIPPAVADGVKAVRPVCRVEHLARWRQGDFRNASDEEILTAALIEDLVLVTRDLGTIPALLKRWMGERRPVAGVAFVSARTIAQRDVGTIVRELVRLYDDPSQLVPGYPIVYLHPGP